MVAETTQHDVEWILTLFGTAVGAGVLFLPIQAGLGGVWPIVILSCFSFPLVWLSHRSLTHLVVTHAPPCELTRIIEEDLGTSAGTVINLLFSIFFLGMVVAYSTGLINLASSYIEHQMGMIAMPRSVLSLLIALGLSAVMLAAGEDALLHITSAVTFPLIAALLFLSVYMIPMWSGAIFSMTPTAHDLIKSLMLLIPIMAFSMDFSPICSLLAISYREHYADARVAMRRSDRTVYWTSLLLMVFVMFFVLSCVLATRPGELDYALKHNIDILTLMSLHIKPPLLRYLYPLLAFGAILHSYFSVFLKARSGLIQLAGRLTRRTLAVASHHTDKPHPVEWITTLLIAVPLWCVAYGNPSILAIIGMLAAPILALVCYLMPVYLFYRIPRLAIYRDRSGIVVLLSGLCVMFSYLIGSLL